MRRHHHNGLLLLVLVGLVLWYVYRTRVEASAGSSSSGASGAAGGTSSGSAGAPATAGKWTGMGNPKKTEPKPINDPFSLTVLQDRDFYMDMYFPFDDPSNMTGIPPFGFSTLHPVKGGGSTTAIPIFQDTVAKAKQMKSL